LRFDIHRLLPLLCGDLQERGGYRNTGVGHHDVQAAEVLHMSRNRRLHAGRIGDVDYHTKSNVGTAKVADHGIQLIVCKRQICH
jgi:hypothetical protein